MVSKLVQAIRNNRRWNYFIKKDFQAKFIASFIIVSLSGGVLAILLFDFLAERKIESILYSMTLPHLSAGDVLFRESVYANAAAVVFVLLVFLLIAVLIRRKVARTLQRVRLHLHDTGRGDLASEIVFDEEDEFRELIEKINSMTGSLNTRFTEISGHVRRLDEAVREMACVMDDVDKAVVKERVMPHILKIEDEMRKFRR